MEDQTAGVELRTAAARWRAVLDQGDIVTERLGDSSDGESSWTVLEHAAYVHAMLTVYTERLNLMLKKKAPKLVAWDSERAIAGANSQDPNKVAYNLALNAGKAAGIIDRIQLEGWSRWGTFRGGSRLNVEQCVQHMVDETNGHLAQAVEIIETLTDDS